MKQITELKLTPEGDLRLNNQNDIDICFNGEAVADHVMIRVKSLLNEAYYMPNVGTELSDYIGRPNTLETGNNIEAEILRALTFDGFLSVNNVIITATPLTESVISVFIDIDPENINSSQLPLQFDINLDTGSII